MIHRKAHTDASSSNLLTRLRSHRDSRCRLVGGDRLSLPSHVGRNWLQQELNTQFIKWNIEIVQPADHLNVYVWQVHVFFSFRLLPSAVANHLPPSNPSNSLHPHTNQPHAWQFQPQNHSSHIFTVPLLSLSIHLSGFSSRAPNVCRPSAVNLPESVHTCTDKLSNTENTQVEHSWT